MTAGVLVVVEQIRGTVRDASVEAIVAGLGLKGALGGPLAVAVVGSAPEAFAERLDLAGVDDVVLVAGETEAFDPPSVADVLEQLMDERDPRLVLLGHTVNAPAVGATIAARRGLGFASGAIAVSAAGGVITARREILGGKVEAELRLPDDRAAIVLLRAAGRTAAEGAGSATVTRTEPRPQPGRARSRHLGYEEAPLNEVDLAKAPFVLTVGRGIGERENLELFAELARRAGAVLASSRPLVDAGWMPRDRQVGQSGATVKPSVYLAFGVSGANEHLAGMRESATIIAVNTDARARIFDVAHLGACADAREVAEELLKTL